jgi:hypothetical protein
MSNDPRVLDMIEYTLRQLAPQSRCAAIPLQEPWVAQYQFGWPIGGTYYTVGELRVELVELNDKWMPMVGVTLYESCPTKVWDRATLEMFVTLCIEIENWWVQSVEDEIQ